MSGVKLRVKLSPGRKNAPGAFFMSIMSPPETTTVNGKSVSSGNIRSNIFLNDHAWTPFLELYDDLVFYFRYASSAYITVCPRPNGKHLCMQVSWIISILMLAVFQWTIPVFEPCLRQHSRLRRAGLGSKGDRSFYPRKVQFNNLCMHLARLCLTWMVLL